MLVILGILTSEHEEKVNKNQQDTLFNKSMTRQINYSASPGYWMNNIFTVSDSAIIIICWIQNLWIQNHWPMKWCRQERKGPCPTITHLAQIASHAGTRQGRYRAQSTSSYVQKDHISLWRQSSSDPQRQFRFANIRKLGRVLKNNDFH